MKKYVPKLFSENKKEGIVKCIYEPRGDHGLEGFALNKSYKYIFIPGNKSRNGKPFYKIYLGEDDFEVVPKPILSKYFKIIK